MLVVEPPLKPQLYAFRAADKAIHVATTFSIMKNVNERERNKTKKNLNLPTVSYLLRRILVLLIFVSMYI